MPVQCFIIKHTAANLGGVETFRNYIKNVGPFLFKTMAHASDSMHSRLYKVVRNIGAHMSPARFAETGFADRKG